MFRVRFSVTQTVSLRCSVGCQLDVTTSYLGPQTNSLRYNVRVTLDNDRGASGFIPLLPLTVLRITDRE